MLWAFVEFLKDGLVVGMTDRPPYTPDMRALVERGDLSLARVPYGLPRRANLLTVTEKGRKVVEAKPLDDAAKNYVVNAFKAGYIR